ncbi:hypothetical protein BRADI_2g09240v3 [Brachypodium distachyon]|uniref:Uncharacterized protein n=1 Tax=Brachypodium distachyon TaxID=15368 RepID=A0A2K2D7M6_BRADI|nr:hypothetical protein BRADI_2g09240v3 [Brachypodium distachyon]
MHGKRDRCIGDGCPPGLTDESLKQDICLLLDQIHGFYKAALDRLPMRAIPSLAPALRKAGICFGFLDPVSNIIANTIAYHDPSPMTGSDNEDDEEDEDEEEEAQEAKELVFSQILTDFDDEDVFEVPLCRHKSPGMTVARRSLDGLVCFLTTHFRYLADTEALRYLRLARADLLTAVRLIERDRNKRRNDELSFTITSLTTKVALECAGVSAVHPEPDVLVKAVLTMASRQIEVAALFSGQYPLSPATVKRLAELLSQGPTASIDLNPSVDLCGRRKKRKRNEEQSTLDLRERKKKKKRNEQPATAAESIDQGSSRADNKRLGSQSTFRHLESLKLLLLGKMRGLYLQALAKLPRDGLRKLHHCSLLKGGYCYGPGDPVSNIILNTIWSDADVWKAIHKAKKHGHTVSVCDKYHKAYKKAALASWHPDPAALVKFATSSLTRESSKLLAIQQGALTNGFVECLAMALPHKSSATKSEEQAKQLKLVSRVLSQNQKRFISLCRKKFKGDQNFFVRKVNAALSNYSKEKGVHYKLHVICGVNPRVPDGSSVCLAKKKFKFEYSHINFLAKTVGPNSAATSPELFFAQCSNSVKEEQARSSWCTPVSDSCMDNVRCFPCEFNGAKIVHPYNETYCGCYEDFKQMAHGMHGTLNEFIISSCDFNADMMCSMPEDWIYFDPNMDSKIAKMTPISNVARELREWGGRIF